ncbi:MAG: aminotransferase class V-fold PLP-dependent enzyme [Acidobacteria bacterium]|jgi:L-seryl-tRNA(Ser) seleniumtransferase|nr:aminotransferase class V-fold PLP-dependent enzyme [Acidobacteriota bacterium]
MKSRAELSRRELLHTALAAPVASLALGAESLAASLPAEAQAAHAAAHLHTPLYERLGVKTFINAYGTLTTLSGSLMPPEVKQAMEEASQQFVQVHDLQARVGARLAELTGAEAAFVTAGAAAGMCLSACAVTAGDDPKKMEQLPDLTGMKNEFIIQKAHRTPYDHAFRMVGVKLVEVETAEDVRRAINPNTAALAMILSHNQVGHKVELEEMIALAHRAGLPLILDAAAELPPAENLSKFVKMGADLVMFSGGKNLRGPQCSGLILGRKDLIAKAYANSSPNNRFARIAKVGKEEIVGLMTAVELFLKGDDAAERRKHHETLDRIAERLKGVPTLFTEYITNDDYSHSPRLSVQWDEEKLGVTLDQMMDRLVNGDPPIVATDMTRYRPNWTRGIGLFPYSLRPGEEIIVADRVRQILTTRT